MNTHQMFRHAQQQLARGQVDGAIDTLALLLGTEPDHAYAHGLLAICLVRRKRLHAARLEAERSVELDPEGLLPHQAIAAVASADRRFRIAEEHLHVARSIDPESADVEIQLAHLYSFWDRTEEAATHAARAVALAPDDPDALTAAGEIALKRRDSAEAAAQARRALAIDPEHVDALVLLGSCDLAAGNTAGARENALWALQLDPMDAPALALICAVKARESLWLGLWWRFQSFVGSGSGTRTILLLLGMYMAYRVAVILTTDAGRQDIASALQVVWLAFAAYTWVAPEWFRRTVRKEIDDVRLRPDF